MSQSTVDKKKQKQQKSLKMALTAKAHFGILIKLSSDSKKN
jgi:hypothetical protein